MIKGLYIFISCIACCSASCAQANSPLVDRFDASVFRTAANPEEQYRHLTAITKALDETANCRVSGLQANTAHDRTNCWFTPPFPLAADFVQGEEGIPVYGWAPTNRDIENDLKHWKEMASRQAVYDCTDFICKGFISVGGAQGQDAIVQCYTIADGQKWLGVPWNCIVVSLRTSTTEWVRVIAGYDKNDGKTLGLPDFDLVVWTKPNTDIVRVLASVEEALKTSPLLLNTTLQINSSERGIVFGTSQYVTSTVLKDYRPRLREMSTVRVDVGHKIIQNTDRILFSISTNLLVNTLASTDPDDWHRPTPAQEQEYVRSVQNSVKRMLEAKCEHAIWRTNHTLTCGLPEAAPLPDWPL